MAHLRLVTRADDAGLNRTTNRAIRATVKQGIVKNVSLIAAGPNIEDAYDRLQDLSDMVDFGLHVCLTSEWKYPQYKPLTEPAQVLTGTDGAFPVSAEDLAEMNPPTALVEDEIAAQLEKLTSLGFKISYIDEHMNVGNIPEVRAAIERIASKASIVYDRTLEEQRKLSRTPNWNGPGPHPGTELADYLAGLGDGTYLLLGHPGFKSDEMLGLSRASGIQDDVLQGRNRERRMFADIEIVDYCENAGVKLLRYSEL